MVCVDYLITSNLRVKGAQCSSEGLERADGVLQIHCELVLAHTPKLDNSQSLLVLSINMY